MRQPKKTYKVLLILLGLSFLLRAVVAALLDLGNDEVYYWTYAMFPDWSHFDHPPMVGWLIQIFTLNLWLNHEFFMRLGAVLGGTVSAWIIFLIGKNIKDELVGFYSAVLYTASVYGSVIAGTFILPDSGQMVFWLAALYFLTKALPAGPVTDVSRRSIMLAGLFIGLAMLSKYTSILLWFGALGYILFCDKRWLRSPWLYAALGISLLLFLPVLFWNWRENFVSFVFHSGRVEVVHLQLRMDYFFTEVLGTFLYQNPVNIAIIIISLISLIRGRMNPLSPAIKILLWCSLPLAMLMPAFSLFRSTLPHWSGPAYAGLILFAAVWLRERTAVNRDKPLLFPLILRLALGLTLIFIVLGTIQIRTGVLFNKEEKNGSHFDSDPTLDLYGWRQLGEKFKTIYEKDQSGKVLQPEAVMLSWRWFPAANLDYYVANPLGMKLYAEGSLDRIHKYAWINRIRGDIPAGSDAYFISSSRDFADPADYFAHQYKTLLPPDTIAIERSGKRVMEFYVFRLLDRLP